MNITNLIYIWNKVQNFIISLDKDKILHCFVCYLILVNLYFGVNALLNTNWISGIISIVIAICCAFGKEIFDDKIKHTYFDWNDIKADCIGIIGGMITIILSML